MRKWCFSDVMFGHFESKSGESLKASRMYRQGIYSRKLYIPWYRFKAERNPKTPKEIKLNALENGCLDFLCSLILAPGTQNFDFSKINAYEI